jgi:hypothetical protein
LISITSLQQLLLFAKLEQVVGTDQVVGVCQVVEASLQESRTRSHVEKRPRNVGADLQQKNWLQLHANAFKGEASIKFSHRITGP